MIERRITLEDFVSSKPCWGEQHCKWWFEKYTNGTISPLEVLSHPELTAVDKVWAALNLDWFNDRTMHELGVIFAKHVLPPDAASRMSLDTKELWLRGVATDAELHEAIRIAWAEDAKAGRSIISPFAAAAFACSSSPSIAANGASTRASGNEPPDIDWEEKEWELQQIKEAIEKLYEI